MKRKGFTLVELLVVIAIIALLMGILMPALAKIRTLAARTICGTNLGSIGKAMLIYANDRFQEYPIAGGPDPVWDDDIEDWDPARSLLDPGKEAYGPGNKATIGSCFYLLIKFADLTTRDVICKGDVGASIFSLSEAGAQNSTKETEAWDFGLIPGNHYSYSYHYPFVKRLSLQPSSKPGKPLCADRNPYYDNNVTPQLAGWDTVQDKYDDPKGLHNSASHQQKGQNVLYNDCHVKFEKGANLGLKDDNIWLYWIDETPPVEKEHWETGEVEPIGDKDVDMSQGMKDAFLVNEVQN